MLKVKDIMTTELITVSPEMEVVQAAKILLEKRINGIPVVDEAEKLVGILCQSDLIAQQKRLPIPSFFTFMDGLFSISSAKQMEKQVQKILDTMTDGPFIFNLGHGIVPQTPPENVGRVVEMVQNFKK